MLINYPVYPLGSPGDTIVVLPALQLDTRALPDVERMMLTNRPVSRKAAAVEKILAIRD